MPFIPPVRAQLDRIRYFQGVGGPVTQVLVKTDDSGRNTSNNIANEVQDWFLGEQGSLILRPGCVRIEETGRLYSIVAIYKVSFAGIQQYGVVYNGTVDLISLPEPLPYSPITIDIPIPDPPPDWPTGWPKPTDLVNEVPVSDPSLPVESQACAVSYTWTGNPATLTFTMPYGGPAPAAQFWYWKHAGYSAGIAFSMMYNADPAWLDTGVSAYWQWDDGPCFGNVVQSLIVSPNGKDIDGNWLVAGTYTFTKSLAISDGTTLAVAITLVVAVAAITLAPTSYAASVVTGDGGNQTKTVRITNSGDTGSTLDWTASFSGDAALTAIMSLSAMSGSLAKSAFTDLTLTLTSPGGLTGGSYTATITFAGGTGVTSKTFAVTLTVVPLYTGSVRIQSTETVTGDPDSVTDATVAVSSDATRNPRWTTTVAAGLTFQLGREVVALVWSGVFQDDAFWNQFGATGQVAAFTVSSFGGTGCPAGSVVRSLHNPINGKDYVWTVTFGAP